jgi:hypothetical protein
MTAADDEVGSPVGPHQSMGSRESQESQESPESQESRSTEEPLPPAEAIAEQRRERLDRRRRWPGRLGREHLEIQEPDGRSWTVVAAG